MSTLLSHWYLPILLELPFVAVVVYFYFKWRPRGISERKLRAYDIVAVLLAPMVRVILAFTVPFPKTSDPRLTALFYILAVQYSLPLFLIAAALLRNFAFFRIPRDNSQTAAV